MPDDNAQAAEQARRLRARFPRWGILFDPLEGVWLAVRGRRTLWIAPVIVVDSAGRVSGAFPTP